MTLKECLLTLEYLTMQIEATDLEELLDGMVLFKTKTTNNIVSLEAIEPIEEYEIAVEALHTLINNISNYHNLGEDR